MSNLNTTAWPEITIYSLFTSQNYTTFSRGHVTPRIDKEKHFFYRYNCVHTKTIRIIEVHLINALPFFHLYLFPLQTTMRKQPLTIQTRGATLGGVDPHRQKFNKKIVAPSCPLYMYLLNDHTSNTTHSIDTIYMFRLSGPILSFAFIVMCVSIASKI